jgi:hypothetical protein
MQEKREKESNTDLKRVAENTTFVCEACGKKQAVVICGFCGKRICMYCLDAKPSRLCCHTEPKGFWD